MKTFGDTLQSIIRDARDMMFLEGESAELTYSAYAEYTKVIEMNENDMLDIIIPIGYGPDNQVLQQIINPSTKNVV